METRKPLTPCKQELLNKTRARGMTEELLQAWTSAPTGFTNIRYVASNANPDELQPVDDEFTKEHAAAVEYLMLQHKLTAEQAIEEVKGITAGEAKFLVIAYKHGVRGETLRNINTEKCTIDSHEFHQAFRYLVDKQKLSAADAIIELDDLTPFQVRLLHELYPYGLRANHIHAVLGGDKDKFADAFDNFGISSKFRPYFTGLFEQAKHETGNFVAALADALDKCNKHMEEETISVFKIPFNRSVAFLSRNQGLFARDLPEHFSRAHQQLFTFLKRKGHDIASEMDDLKQLDPIAAKLLVKYYKDGVTAKDLLTVKDHDRDSLERSIKLLTELNHSPKTAIQTLAESVASAKNVTEEPVDSSGIKM